MDGVVLQMPPDDPIERENLCHVDDNLIWRKRTGASKPEFEGGDMFNKRVPQSRALPMWGGIGPGGFGLVTYRKFKNMDQREWSAAVTKGKLLKSCRSARPDRFRGPWRVLCDNESFLKAPAARAAHETADVELWHIPQRSPDLNPVERFWGWLRKRLRAMDLADLKAGRKAVKTRASKARVPA